MNIIEEKLYREMHDIETDFDRLSDIWRYADAAKRYSKLARVKNRIKKGSQAQKIVEMGGKPPTKTQERAIELALEDIADIRQIREGSHATVTALGLRLRPVPSIVSSGRK